MSRWYQISRNTDLPFIICISIIRATAHRKTSTFFICYCLRYYFTFWNVIGAYCLRLLYVFAPWALGFVT